MKSTMEQFRAALAQREAAVDILRRLEIGPTACDEERVMLVTVPGCQIGVTVGEIRRAIGNPFGMGK